MFPMYVSNIHGAVRTLHSIVHELGHHGRIVDAVKIDIEGPRIGYEDKAIRSIIETVSFSSGKINKFN